MRAAISEPLQAYLRQQGRTVLTITLKPLRCCGGTLFEVLVDTREPKDPGRYASFVQDDLSIYYSPEQADPDRTGRPGGKRPHRAPVRQASPVDGSPLVALDVPCIRVL